MTSAVLSKLLGAKPGALGNPVVRAGMNLPAGVQNRFHKKSINPCWRSDGVVSKYHMGPLRNSTPIRGVRFDMHRGKWLAQIKVKGKAFNLGRYQTREEALTARADAAQKRFGQFA